MCAHVSMCVSSDKSILDTGADVHVDEWLPILMLVPRVSAHMRLCAHISVRVPASITDRLSLESPRRLLTVTHRGGTCLLFHNKYRAGAGTRDHYEERRL